MTVVGYQQVVDVFSEVAMVAFQDIPRMCEPRMFDFYIVYTVYTTTISAYPQPALPVFTERIDIGCADGELVVWVGQEMIHFERAIPGGSEPVKSVGFCAQPYLSGVVFGDAIYRRAKADGTGMDATIGT